MTFDAFALLAVILLSITSMALLVINEWRLSILLLSLQYVAVFILTAINWPLQMAIVKPVAGWMAGAVIGLAILSSSQSKMNLANKNFSKEKDSGENKLSSFIKQGGPFHLIAAGLVFLSVIYLEPQLEKWFPDIIHLTGLGGLILIGMGLLKLGFTDSPFPITLGLLTLFSGFEVIFANLENSALVAGLLAIITLGLSLSGAYLLLTLEMGETE